MPRFYVWDSEDGGEERDDAELVEAFDAEMAAQEIGERRYSDSDYPKTQTFNVEDERGEVVVCVVSAEQAVMFTTRTHGEPRRVVDVIESIQDGR